MAGEPTILGTGGSPTGWRTLFDYADGLTPARRVRMMMGPASSIDAAMTAVRAALACETLDPSVSPGSAVASLRIVYNTALVSGLPAGERRYPIYELTPQMIGVKLQAHYQLTSIQKVMPKIEKYIAAGDIAGLKAEFAGNDLAIKYARLQIAGVETFEMAGFDLSVTRYYTNAPSLAADYAKINQVFAWSAITTDGQALPASLDEPKRLALTGAALGFEWRLVSVAPVIQRGEDNVVRWNFLGLESWAKWLYRGGTWEPDAL